MFLAGSGNCLQVASNFIPDWVQKELHGDLINLCWHKYDFIPEITTFFERSSSIVAKFATRVRYRPVIAACLTLRNTLC